MRLTVATSVHDAAASSLAAENHDGEWAAACAYAQELVLVYFRMLTVGCASSECTNDWCASNPRFLPLSADDAAIRSILLATKSPIPICASLVVHSRPTLTPVASTTRTLSANPEEQPETTTENDAEETNNGQDHHDKGDPALSVASDGDKRPCTPRRRLSTAMEIAQELHASDNNGSSHHVEPSDMNGAAPSTRPVSEERGQPRRRMSYTKQKLLDAIKGSFARRGSKKTRSSETKA